MNKFTVFLNVSTMDEPNDDAFTVKVETDTIKNARDIAIKLISDEEFSGYEDEIYSNVLAVIAGHHDNLLEV